MLIDNIIIMIIIVIITIITIIITKTNVKVVTCTCNPQRCTAHQEFLGNFISRDSSN